MSIKKALKEITPPTGVKMNCWPTEFQVLLRLQTMKAKGKLTLRVSWLTKDLELGTDLLVDTLLGLKTQALISMTPPVAVDGDWEFTFDVPGEVSEEIKQHAACQYQSIRQRKFRIKQQVERRKARQSRYPYISFENAARHLDAGITLAGFLGKAPKLVEQMCRCIVRLGEAQVALLVQEAVAAGGDDSKKRIARFFELYTIKRDELFPQPKGAECQDQDPLTTPPESTGSPTG